MLPVLTSTLLPPPTMLPDSASMYCSWDRYELSPGSYANVWSPPGGAMSGGCGDRKWDQLEEAESGGRITEGYTWS